MTNPAAYLTAIEKTNRATLQAIAAGTASPATHPYFGYYGVDIFDCPPFLMFTNNDCPIAANILYNRRFELGSMALWCRLARTATSIIDIGAQVGVYTLAAATLRRDIAVHAFEPNPYAYTRLRMHKTVNALSNVVQYPIAIGHKEASTTIAWEERGTISSGARLGAFEELGNALGRAQVPLMPLDHIPLGLVGDRSLMKIDVEGAEGLVFAGMTHVLAARPDIICETFVDDACDTINQIIQPLGYRVYAIDETDGGLALQPMIAPRSRKGGNFNYFLTARPV